MLIQRALRGYYGELNGTQLLQVYNDEEFEQHQHRAIRLEYKQSTSLQDKS